MGRPVPAEAGPPGLGSHGTPLNRCAQRASCYVASYDNHGAAVQEKPMAEQRTLTDNFTFNHPFFLTNIGQELPAGTYPITYTEIKLPGSPVWQILQCKISIPPGVIKPGDLGAKASVNWRELEQKCDPAWKTDPALGLIGVQN